MQAEQIADKLEDITNNIIDLYDNKGTYEAQGYKYDDMLDDIKVALLSSIARTNLEILLRLEDE